MYNSVTIMPFDDIFYKDCLYNPFLSAVQFYGINLNAFWSNDYYIYEFDKTGILKSSIKTVRSEEEICHNFGMRFKVVKDLSYEQLRISLEQNKLLLVTIDKFYWKNPRLNKDYLKKHIEHYFLIYGINNNSQDILIIDVYKDLFNFKCFKSVIGFESLLEAYRGYRDCNIEVLNRTVEINRFYQEIDSLNYCDVFLKNTELILDNLKKSLDEILSAKLFFFNLHDKLDQFIRLSEAYLHLPKHYKDIQKYEYEKLLSKEASILNYVENSGNAYRHFIFLLMEVFTTKKATPHILSRIIKYIDEIYIAELNIYNELNNYLYRK